MTTSLPAVLLAVFFFGAAIEAQESVLVLQDGQSLSGVVMGSTADSVTFKYGSGGREMTATFRAANLDPHSFYGIRAASVGADAQQLLELAKFAAEHRMFIEAIAQYTRAKSVDPKLVESFEKTELPGYLDDLAARLLADAKDALAAGDIAGARSLVDDILARLTKTPAAEEAKVLIREIGEKAAKQAIEKQAKSETGKRKCTVDSPCPIALRNGTVVTGRVLESTDDSVTFTFQVDGKDATTTLRARELDPHTFYEIRSASLGDDAASHLALGRFAASQGMYGQARMHYEIAKSLDPTLVAQFDKEELPKIKAGIAARLLAEAKAAQKKDQLADAGRTASTILTLFFDTPAAAEAKTLVDSVYRELARRSLAEMAARAEEQSEEARKKAEAERRLVLGPVLEMQERGQKHNLEGLKESQTSQSLQDFKWAAAEFQQALSLLEPIAAKYAQDREWTRTIESYRSSITDELVNALVNAGSIALTRSSIPEALGFANQALAADSTSSHAQAFRARVESSTSSDNRWPRRWRRR